MHILSYVIMGILILVYISPLNFYNTSIEPFNYVLRSTYHANLSHLAANLFSFYFLSSIGDIIGEKHFLMAIIFIWIVSSILLYLYQQILPSRKFYTVGFSAVIFGLFVVYYSLIKQNNVISVGALLISIVPQILIPGISWEGHICGIIAGIIYVLLFKNFLKPVN